VCGLVGLFACSRSVWFGGAERVVADMADTLRHRGPDDQGLWCDRQAAVWLAHRRLSIQDTSPGGHQPMTSADGRWTIVFNGEIYNFRELAKGLEDGGWRSRGHSDTEVLLELVAAVGPRRALERSRGMFALALWDDTERALYLARDRMGEKPLYYGWLGKTFVFGSELRALRRHPDWNGRIDRSALASFLRYNCIPAPLSIFEGIRKLEPGQFLTLRAGSREATIERYWDPDRVLLEALANPWKGSPEEYVDTLGETLGSAVCDQMVSDVPLGAFLSGGVDSSLIVALMQTQSAHPIRTFNVGFAEAEFDESSYAREIAGILGTDHTEERLSGADALARVPSLPECYDEPFADSSQLPTMLVSEVARRHVTVSLSGDGGDELFGGYTRYQQILQRWQAMSARPASMRRLAALAGDSVPEGLLALIGRAVQVMRPRPVPPAGLGWRVRQRLRALGDGDLPAAYLRAVSFWDRPDELVVEGKENFDVERELACSSFASRDSLRWMMYRDSRIYLPDDILVKVDRASMRVSLESRIPLLDHRVVEMAWRAPTSLAFHDGRGKWPLRALLARYIPDRLIDRPKMGFAVPLRDWLRGPLRDWAADLLDEQSLLRDGYLRPQPILQRWVDLQAGGDGHELPLWSVLMFQSWLQHWGTMARSQNEGTCDGPIPATVCDITVTDPKACHTQ